MPLTCLFSREDTAEINRLQAAVEVAVRENRIDHVQAGQFVKFYEEALNGYTYLEEPDGE